MHAFLFGPATAAAFLPFKNIPQVKAGLKSNIHTIKELPLKHRQSIGQFMTKLNEAKKTGWKGVMLAPDTGVDYGLAKHELAHMYSSQTGAAQKLDPGNVRRFRAELQGKHYAYRQQFEMNPDTAAEELLAFAHTPKEVLSDLMPWKMSPGMYELLTETKAAHPIAKLKGEAYASLGKKTAYLSGAMSGLPDRNYRAFMRGQRALEREGLNVLNPAPNQIDPKILASGNKKRIWGAFMRQSYQQVKEADVVVAMPEGMFGSLGDWTASSGARMEQEWAKRLNKPFIQLDGMEHGGWAEAMRKALTDFGSMWQGLRKLFGKGMKEVASTPNYRKVQSWDPLTGENVQTVYAPTAKRRSAMPPGRKSIPLSPIEGMPSGGCGEKMRKALTEFGSPWRGLTGIPQKLLYKIAGTRAGGVSVDIASQHTFSDILSEAGKYWGTKSTRYQQFATQMGQAKEAGHKAMVFMPTSRKNMWGKEVPIKYTGEQFKELKSTIRHERTHQFNPMKGELGKSVQQHFRDNRLPPAAMEKLRSLGYKGQAYDEILAIMSEVRYRKQFTDGTIADLRRRSKHTIGAYGEDVFKAAMKLEATGIQLAKGDSALYRAGRRAAGVANRRVRAMQWSTDMVKANTTGMTVPGLASTAKRGGSRQTPHGGN